MALQQGGFLGGVGQRHVHNEHGQQIGLARIEAALEHMHIGQRGLSHAQCLSGQTAQGRQRMDAGRVQRLGAGGLLGIDSQAFHHGQGGQGEFEFGQADHGGSWTGQVGNRQFHGTNAGFHVW